MASARTRLAEWIMVAALLPLAAWVLWAELRPARASRSGGAPYPIAITATPQTGNGVEIAGVRLAGALALSSTDSRFGGLSGLAALPDGRLVAVTDAGDWLWLRPVVRDGQLTGVAGAMIGSLPGPPGGEKYDMDAESLRITATGGMIVGMEQQHRILIYDAVPPRTLVGTQWHTEAGRWQANGGGEALALLPGGKTLWLPEHARAGKHRALLIDAAGHSRTIAVAGLPGFAITDAVALAKDRVLLLHRRFTGFETAAALSVIELAPVHAGAATVKARPMLQWSRDSAWPIDNMEGAALVREGGKPVLYLMSDDNFSASQRTLLLRLELPSALAQG